MRICPAIESWELCVSQREDVFKTSIGCLLVQLTCQEVKMGKGRKRTVVCEQAGVGYRKV